MDNAIGILDAAESAIQSGYSPTNMTILVSAEGGIRMIADSDWSLNALAAEQGAGMLYRVSRQQNKVRIEGREGPRTCLFETAQPNWAARALLSGSVGIPAITPEAFSGTVRLLPEVSD